MVFWAGRLIGGLGVDVTYRGSPPSTPVLFAGNHRSYLDILVLAARLPVAFMAKAEIKSWPILGPSAGDLGAIYVKREESSSRHDARDALRQRLEAGVSVVIFPEGTTSRGPGTLPFRHGAFGIAIDNGVPVVPVSIHYEDPALAWIGDDSFLPHFLRVMGRRRHRICVHIGEPLHPQPGTSAALLAHDTRNLVQRALETCPS